ncbi:glutamate synthase large subunit [Halolamina sp. CBA1230]|uniref:glutamate synthase large subunit n=1 Tax=Halolamina sp. CBA1230 TaxID=1853690 RepID=UPI0009A19D27|nr:glutamate synthase large subunit [Halolamina sp. CBA1230]QKY20222.1 glutamate synthase large subunit [Halolamina sp. CBA1230]
MSKSTTNRTARLADPSGARSNCGVGAVVDLESGPSHRTVADALELLGNLEHRGATGADADTGDGAGIMLQRPDRFFEGVLDADLPETYAVGSVFMPEDAAARESLMDRFEEHLTANGIEPIAWRDVPTDNEDLGETALEAEPDVWQLFVAPDGLDVDEFDRALYVARKETEHAIAEADVPGAERFYVCSLDRERLVYKGLLTSEQLPEYYPDLTDERVESEIALVHARFSTNTLGAWHLAHPYRGIVHNGEFNTIQGNVNWMRARETDLAADAFGDDLETLKPIVDDPEQSDTASVDNTLELLTSTGRSVEHALRMLIPEAYRGDDEMPPERTAFYDYHASLIEPWDGPALVVATDGQKVAAALDRNGLRPCRYDVTGDGRLIISSEVGALDVDAAEIERRERLSPGQLLVADPAEGRVVPDDEVFDDLADENYAEWVEREQQQLPERESFAPRGDGGPLRARQAAFGYTHDQLEHMIEPMAREGKDPVGSMGDDTPISALADHERPLFSYFKQLFAQVSNPPIDYIREELVTSLETRLGHQRNLLDETPEHARQLVLDSPVLTDDTTARIKDLDGDGELGSAVVDTTFEPDTDLETAVENLRADATAAIEDGADIVVLSDRRLGPDRLAIPSLLATGAVHHSLVRNGLRNHAGIVVESGDPREVHHLATLVGYGAGAVNPYLAYETIEDAVAGPDGADRDEAIGAYVEALEDGLLKTMAKMGISTVESYQGAQRFEALGLDDDLVAEYFEGTRIRTGGIDLDGIEDDLRARHAAGFDRDPELDRQGEYESRTGGIRHGWNRKTVGTIQQAVRQGDYGIYEEFAELVEGGERGPETLRGLLAFDSDREPVDIGEVESIESLVERFSTAAMSLGSLSPEAHENNAIAMSRTGGKANTGEGGEPPERFDTERACEVKQVASGRFGVTADYLASAEELQIKMAQGSKPGEGGHLPGSKVNEMIAHVRHATPGVGLISPPPLHDIYSIEDLKQLIFDLKSANPDADVNVKLVSEDGIGTIAAGVAKANADVLHISGHDGGTGASPKTSIKNAGLPWELGLAEANQFLRQTGMRDRIRVSVDGGFKTGRDVAVAAALGAEEYVFGTASLITSGCVMARQCHENTCPVGVATQDPDLRDRFPGEPDHVVNYVTFVARHLREIMAELGFTELDEMVGRPDLLTQPETDHPRASQLDLSPILADPGPEPRRKVKEQTHPGVDDHYDRDLLDAAEPAIESGESVHIDRDVTNADRAVGTMLSSEIAQQVGLDGLPDGTIRADLTGTAGQSFGAFLKRGVTLRLTGAANDYVGKGLSGGRLVVQPPDDAAFDPTENVLAGNVALYGATDGELYVNGTAGERFAVRNSGATAVVEGVGDHGCEYMTGGIVAVLGDVGKNFAAGMSGGVAYVYDPEGDLERRANTGMVTLSTPSEKDERVLRRLVENHVAHTDSERGRELLDEWEATLAAFTKVMPDAYSRVIEEEGRADVRDSPPAAVADAATRPPRSASTGD